MLARSFLASLVAASVAYASPIASTLTARGVKPECLPSGIEESCGNIVSACLFFIGDGNGAENQLWHQQACVAAATCYGVGNLLDKVSCQVGASVANQAQISLDYNIYAGIVGDCAWDPNGCPITQQNYIDFYYGTLTKLNSSAFPSSANTVIGWWDAIASWTATGNTIPYLNFNDWLHYSSYPSGGVTSSTVAPTTVSVTSIVSPTTVSASSTISPITVSSSAIPTAIPSSSISSVTATEPAGTSTAAASSSAVVPTTVA